MLYGIVQLAERGGRQAGGTLSENTSLRVVVMVVVVMVGADNGETHIDFDEHHHHHVRGGGEGDTDGKLLCLF